MSALDPSSYTATQEALARCRRYRKEHGLYGVVDSALGRIMLEIGAVGAVTMPADLGKKVCDRLKSGQRCGPVIAHPRSGRWTFLTGPTDDSYLDMSLFSDLFSECAAVALPGSHIVLPSPTDEHNGYRAWICPPIGDFRPDLGEVVSATRECRVH
ncbi:hypothetical protein [Nocardia huaxiensis]|uniref:DNA-directed RNA polymerase subunit beta n=1 Tax=Nocardia huaxiensis TaxID=2755382 RepID=A0A7D6VIV6_9NOCA|nr:hypothetical protein [Nocardia huaxiensis]QLY31036.1 hypothetical protein H0264_01130 [Nocardia huaxiensis]UFS94560.1 hypothetical protein LPY97_27965 [Nocardia huaxiensis]